MIRPSFDITALNINPAEWEQSILLLEVSGNFLGCVWYNQPKQKLLGVRHYNFEDTVDKSSRDLMEELLKEDLMLNSHVSKVVMVYHYPESTLVPETYFQSELNRPVLDLMFGDAEKGLVMSEKIDILPVYNVYRIPPDIHKLFQQKFTSSSYWHYYTLQLSFFQIEKDSPADLVRIRVMFYADKFIVGAFRDGELLILQSFTYQTPEDVSYYLLTVLNAHDVNQENVVLKISGLIDEDSILYTELNKYFQYLTWDPLPAGIDPAGILKQFPSHYFSPLVRMALCV
ncbi:DUF3822 family protein [Flavitalea sp.]|nr:DUF3822 family protein [Flavitalea sp.]